MIYKYDIFNCNWVDTRWQQYSTHLHTNNTQNNTINLGRVRTVPRLCELYPGVCLTTEEKARKNLSQGSRRMLVDTMGTECTEENRICRPLTVRSKSFSMYHAPISQSATVGSVRETENMDSAVK